MGQKLDKEEDKLNKPNFPLDCITVITSFLDLEEFQNLLGVNKFYHNFLISLDLPHFEKYRVGDMKRMPRKPKPYIGNLRYFQKPFTKEITKFFPNLSRIRVYRVKEVHGDAFKEIPKLKYLEIDQCYSYDGSGLEYLKSLRFLKISLKGSPLVFKNEQYKYLEGINELIIHRGEIKKKVSKQISSNLKQLEKLELNMCDISSSNFKVLLEGVSETLRELKLKRLDFKFKPSILRSCVNLSYVLITLGLGIEMKREDILKHVPSNCEVVCKRAQRQRFCL